MVGIAQAASYLRHLLTQAGPYRRRWERSASRLDPDSGLLVAAVCRVIAEHLWDSGERAETQLELPRQLRDRVRRAVSGTVLTSETLGWFIDAFGIEPDEAALLWSLLSGEARWLAGAPLGLLPEQQATSLGEPHHRTLSLHEHHFVGGDGLPVRHRTVQVIEALVDGFRSYPYRFDSDALTVEVVMGGHVRGPIHAVTDVLYAVDIELTDALAAGQTATIEYHSSFCYRTPPPPEFRRAALRRVENLDMRVQFDPGLLPASVWWARWTDLDQPPIERTEVGLDGHHAVHRFVNGLERSAVGFCWAW
jgi:hypothetical protein